MRLHLEAVVLRGAIEESRHLFECGLADLDGRLVAGTAQPGLVSTFRSSAKPFQLLPLVERGHADRWGFSDAQLAVMAASHTGSREHIRLVSGILERIGRTPADLICGYHDPEDPESREDVFGGSTPRNALYNNCSGKHAGILALALAEGWPIAGYERLEHPVQQLLRRTVAEVCGLAPEALGIAVDGCGLIVFALPLAAMARGYAVLAAAAASSDGDTRTRALGRIGRVMGTQPMIVEGAGRLSTALMQVTRGRVIAKGGAEGLQLVALTDRAQGLALKCEDGAGRALGPVLVTLLEQLGALSAAEASGLESVRRPPIRNAAGEIVGGIEARVHAIAAVQ